MSRPRAEVVWIQARDPDSGAGLDDGFWGIAVDGPYGATILRLASSQEELRGAVGDLSDPQALWQYVQERDPTIGTWDGEPLPPLSI